MRRSSRHDRYRIQLSSKSGTILQNGNQLTKCRILLEFNAALLEKFDYRSLDLVSERGYQYAYYRSQYSLSLPPSFSPWSPLLSLLLHPSDIRLPFLHTFASGSPRASRKRQSLRSSSCELAGLFEALQVSTRKTGTPIFQHETIAGIEKSIKGSQTSMSELRYVQGHLTHGKVLLEVFLAADEMSDISRHLIRKCSAMDLNPVPHLLRAAGRAEVSGDGYGEFLEDQLHHSVGGK